MMQTQQPQHAANFSIDNYQGYAGLPPLAGILTMHEAATSGLMVNESVDRLKRLHWSLKRLHSIWIARIPAIPIYELKMAFSLHAYCCAEHVDKIAHRIREMRQPPYGLEVVLDRMLDTFFDEILAAPSTEALVLGLYEKAVPAVVRALEHVLADTNKLFDHPTYRLARFALLEMQEVQDYGVRAVCCLVKEGDRTALENWLPALDRMLAAAGDLDGKAVRSEEDVERQFSATPYHYDPVPKRDERFKDPYNMGVNAEAMLFDPNIDPLPKTIMLYFKRMREIDVPEMMSRQIAAGSFSLR
jgi:hypothetical protein